MCSSYRKFEPPRFLNFREKKKSGSDPGQLHYAMITDAHSSISEEYLKISKRYPEAVVFEIFLKDYIFLRQRSIGSVHQLS
jgi:hypothetical protein